MRGGDGRGGSYLILQGSCYFELGCQFKFKLNCYRLAMDTSPPQPDTSIPQYESLPPPPELNEELLNQIDQHIKGSWTESQQCITMIRQISKHFPQHIPDVFTKYGPAILDLFTHAAPLLLKNILKMLGEVFGKGAEVNLEGCINAFLPLLARKAAMDSGQVKGLCQEVLTVIASKCCYCNTIELTTKLSCDEKNLALAELAIKLLAGILNSLSGNLTQINPTTLQTIMQGMDYLIHGKRNNMKTSALDVCLFIFGQIGSENYLQLMSYSLSPEAAKEMGEAMEGHRTQKAKTPHLSEVLKQHKAQGGRQSGAWGGNLRM